MVSKGSISLHSDNLEPAAAWGHLKPAMVNTDVFISPCFILAPDGSSYLCNVDFSLFHIPNSASAGLEKGSPQEKQKETDYKKVYVCPNAQC